MASWRSEVSRGNKSLKSDRTGPLPTGVSAGQEAGTRGAFREKGAGGSHTAWAPPAGPRSCQARPAGSRASGERLAGRTAPEPVLRSESVPLPRAVVPAGHRQPCPLRRLLGAPRGSRVLPEFTMSLRWVHS